MPDYDFDSLLDDLGGSAGTGDGPSTPTENPTPIPESMLRANVKKKLAADPTYQYSKEFQEIQDATRKYLISYFDVDARMRDLKQEMKDVKEDAKEEGVPVNNVSKAIKELISELKETTVDAQNVEETKRFIKADDNFYSNVVAMSQ